ncbi:MAG: hypothetical protein HQM09_03200 [Candidatus Riflebacteria bacterium]|nr:hypothetical protein [Candidatus Riflebacteria bacterium]
MNNKMILPVESENDPWEKQIIKQIAGYMTEDNYQFKFIADDCLELYLQGKNLIMRMLVYAHNKHLVIRIPAFIRGDTDLRRLDFLLAVMKIMNDYFDIRLELADDGHSLSGSSNHVLEDGTITRSQFSQCFSVVAFLVDESYPRLMKILCTPPGVLAETSPSQITEESMPDERASDDEPDNSDELEQPASDIKRQIN